MIYYLRMFLLALYFIPASIVGIIVCLFRPTSPRNTYYMGKIYGFGIFPLMGVDIHHHHTEKFNQIPGAAILIANHQENFDTFLIGCFCPKYTVSVGKRSILWVPLFGLVYYLAGNILINRKNRREALRSMDHAGQTVVDKKVKILIMPEGTRSR
jgi:1-acyl-sn-glycerol-3-phosphate acyltransferase